MKVRFITAAALVLLAAIALTSFSPSASARPSHKPIILELTPATPAETKAQEMVKADSCNACHVKDESKKERNAYGMAILKGLGGDKFKYDKDFWAKTDDKYTPAAIQKLRDAINDTEKPKEK